jgi:Ricin-type beta-trefoil lectin domain
MTLARCVRGVLVVACLFIGCRLVGVRRQAVMGPMPTPHLYTIPIMNGCLGVAGGVLQKGAALEVKLCDDSLAQLFKITSTGELRTFDERFCVDVACSGGCGAGRGLQLCDCRPGTESQQFTFDNEVRSVSSGECFDMGQNDLEASFPASVWLAQCNGFAAAQRFVAHPTATMIRSGLASTITEIPFDGFDAGVPHTIATTDVSAGGDPVLHVLWHDPDADWRQTAMNDNNGDELASRVTFMPESGNRYLVVVRAHDNNSAGTCNLTVDGQLWRANVGFGGYLATLEDVRAQETIHTIRQPRQSHMAPSQPSHLLYALDGATGAIHLRADGGGIAGGASFRAGQLSGSFPRPFKLAVGVPAGGVPGPVRVLRNDHGLHDLDLDDLGTELEAELGTCDVLTGNATLQNFSFDCHLAADARDTDGDGLLDGWEVLGHPAADGDDPLPEWGADPRHMDMFLEMDFQQHCSDTGPTKKPGEVCDNPESDMPITRDDAREFAQTYGDEMRRTTAAQRQVHAVELRNPDGRSGISVHIDSGLDPDPAAAGYQPADWKRFGDWGGHNLIAWDKDPYLAGGDPAWKLYMRTGRRGVFRYGHGFNGCESQTDRGYWCSAPIAPGCGGTVGAHECGHANGLTHHGGGSPGNCKPLYASVMSYAFTHTHGIGFSDPGELAPKMLNNTALPETPSPPYSPLFRKLLGESFGYWVTDTTVDWNRDGLIAPAGETVRAYSNSLAGGQCEFTRTNTMDIVWSVSPSPNAITKSVAISRLNGRVYIFQEVGGHVAYKSIDKLDCPSPTQSCGTWTDEQQLSDVDNITGFDVLRLPTDPTRLLLVYVRGSQLALRLLSAGASGLTATAPVAIANDATTAPALASWNNRVYLAYRASDGNLRYASGDGTSFGGITATAIPLSEYTSPSLVAANLDGPGTPYKLYGAFARPAQRGYGTLRLYVFDGATWTDTTLLFEFSTGRSALQWMPPRDEAHLGAGFPPRGRLYVLTPYSSLNADGTSTNHGGQMAYSMRKNDQAPLEIGQLQSFDNASLRIIGIAAMFEPGVDSNLRVIHSLQNDSYFKGHSEARPLADGIVDVDLTVGHDWVTLRQNICLQLRRGMPDAVRQPFLCPDQL